jgi:type I restriction enzyme S subunit
MSAVSEVEAAIVNPEIRLLSEVERGYTSFQEDDVLFAKITPCMENGKAALARGLLNNLGFGSTEFHVLRPDRTLLLPEYLYYFIRQPAFRNAAKQRMRGAVGQQRVPEDFLGMYSIPLPPLSEQRRIVEILDQADALRRKRAEADARAERILPALFYRMFGDPATNPMGWEVTTLDQISKIVTGNTPSREHAEYFGSDYPWARPADLEDQLPITKTEQGLSQKGALVGRVVPENSVLVCCIGATLGKVGLAGVRMAINQQINALLPTEKATPEFLYVMCLLNREVFRAAATQQTLPILNKSRFGRQKAILPPIQLQKEFSETARELLHQYHQRKQCITTVEKLFRGLLHRAFTGDLTARWRGAHMKELLVEMEEQARLLGNSLSAAQTTIPFH